MTVWEAIGKSDEWYTPKYIFDAMGVVFDLDVAGRAMCGHVPCRSFWFRKALERDWSGFVWMNPPFGGRNEIKPWLKKFIEHGNGVALTPDRTSAPWFQKAAIEMNAVLFISPKVKFERADGSVGRSPSTGTALMAKGQKGVNALVNARNAGLGLLMVTYS